MLSIAQKKIFLISYELDKNKTNGVSSLVTILYNLTNGKDKFLNTLAGARKKKSSTITRGH